MALEAIDFWCTLAQETMPVNAQAHIEPRRMARRPASVYNITYENRGKYQ
jgi:cephalosporin-C deacetylase-like acetyl esterase